MFCKTFFYYREHSVITLIQKSLVWNYRYSRCYWTMPSISEIMAGLP